LELDSPFVELMQAVEERDHEPEDQIEEEDGDDR
jgi:hypothetical protein